MNSEVDLADPVGVPVRRRARVRGPVLAVVAIGGGLGAVARYGLTVLLPTPQRGFPWATFLVNVLGCLLIGVVMVLVTEVYAAHRLVRPFLGVGVLGGFTTFSTYALEIHSLLRPGTVGIAFAYLATTFVAAMLAVLAGTWVTRAVTGRRS